MKATSNAKDAGSRDERIGSVMVVVLILVVLLSLAAYSYTELMVTEYSAAEMYGRRIQTQAFADSAVETAADIIANRTFAEDENLVHNTELFSGVQMSEGATAWERGRFSIVAPNEHDPSGSTIRFGFQNESARLNINSALELEELLELQGLTIADLVAGISGFDNPEIVDAVLDWIDEDDDPRPYGAESSYYEGLDNGYPARNGPLESVDELLQVKGITAEILYGEDANRNGLLDPNEDDGEASLPVDNEDGILDLGLSAFLTVLSRESNLRADGSERINLNQGLMTELFDAVEEEFGEDVARYVVAYRLFGSPDATEDLLGEGLTVDQEEAAKAIGSALAGGVEGAVTRAGLDLTKTPEYTFSSLFDLVGAEVPAEIEGSPQTLASPWTEDTGDMLQYLPVLFDTFTLTDDPFLVGRIDLNQARREVLLTIPDMTEELADAIVSRGAVDLSGQLNSQVIATHTTPGWLVVEGLVDVPTMRKLERYLTTRGDIFRIQAVGFFDEGGPATRLEAILDGTESPPQIKFLRDMSSLGRGYSDKLLQIDNGSSGSSSGTGTNP